MPFTTPTLTVRHFLLTTAEFDAVTTIVARRTYGQPGWTLLRSLLIRHGRRFDTLADAIACSDHSDALTLYCGPCLRSTLLTTRNSGRLITDADATLFVSGDATVCFCRACRPTSVTDVADRATTHNRRTTHCYTRCHMRFFLTVGCMTRHRRCTPLRFVLWLLTTFILTFRHTPVVLYGGG